MFQKLLLKMLPMIISAATPEIKAGIKEMLATLKEKAYATPNPVDDILVELLDEILDV